MKSGKSQGIWWDKKVGTLFEKPMMKLAVKLNNVQSDSVVNEEHI